MKLLKYTLEQLTQAIKESSNYRQTLDKLGVVPAGGNYQILKKAIKYFELDASHFTGHASNKGKKFGPKRNIEEYLTNTFPIQSHKLRLRLLNDGVLEPVCSKCRLTTWLDQPIPLELDHINGIHSDNTLTNLQLLCPNCHAQTENYRGRNMLKN